MIYFSVLNLAAHYLYCMDSCDSHMLSQWQILLKDSQPRNISYMIQIYIKGFAISRPMENGSHTWSMGSFLVFKGNCAMYLL